MLKKWLIVIAVPMVCQALFLAVLLRSQLDQADAQKWAVHTTEVIARGESVLRSIAEARGDVLARILARGGASPEFDRLARAIPGELRLLDDQVSDNREHQLDVARSIEGKVRAYLADLGAVDGLIRKGDHEAASARMQSVIEAGAVTSIRAQMGGFLGKEKEFDFERREALKRKATSQLAMIAVGAVTSVLIAAGLIYGFNRGFIRRVEVLRENARRLAEGKALVEPLSGADEIVQVDAAFRAMAKSLAERDQENEMFIYSVSHDLRSPLVNLQGFSRELSLTAEDVRVAVAPLEKSPAVAARLERLLVDDMSGSIRFIQTAVSRLSAIIDSLLRLSRAGRVEYRLQPLEMQEIVGRVVESLKNSKDEKDASIAVGDLPPAHGDATAVEQIFANLLSNAVKYLDPSRPGRIEVGATDPAVGGDGGATTTYYVRDNGLGIPQAHQSKLFLAFQRLHPGVAQGEGIGLALVRRMVERLGGRIWVESEAGQGSTFFLTLPSRPADPRRNGEISWAASAAGAND